MSYLREDLMVLFFLLILIVFCVFSLKSFVIIKIICNFGGIKGAFCDNVLFWVSSLLDKSIL